MEDSNLWDVRRLTTLLLNVKRYERQMEAQEKTAATHDVLEPFENAGRSHDVIENKCRKNVCFSSHHDVDENKRVKPCSPRCY